MMECQGGDSKKITKVYDATQHKRSRKKRDGLDDTNSVATDESGLGCHQSCRNGSAKNSAHELTTQSINLEDDKPKRDNEIDVIFGDSSPSAQSAVDIRRSSRHRRHHRRAAREEASLALKAGVASTPRSNSPTQDGDGAAECMQQDHDSFIYTYLEEAIKKDKKKRRHSHRREDRDASATAERENERDRVREERGRDRERQRHHHRTKNVTPTRDTSPDKPVAPVIDQMAFFKTFAKMCAQMQENNNNTVVPLLPRRSQSHKSLQCEPIPKKEIYNYEPPTKLQDIHSRETLRKQSQANCFCRTRSYDKMPQNDIERCKLEKSPCNREKSPCNREKEFPKYYSKMDVTRSRTHHAIEDDRFREYQQAHVIPTRSCIDPYRRSADYRDYDREVRARHYEEDKRKYIEQKTSRSFDLHREYHDEERVRRSARSDPKDRKYEERDKRYDDLGKYYDEKTFDLRERMNHTSNKARRWRRNLERLERNSVASRDDDRDRDRYSEKERDSGLSVADGDTSTISGRSNYLKVVKQEITEQREAMDKMMKLWKDLMRCFKGISQTQQGQNKNVQDSTANVRESAAEQMRLWWECMRRYETVARDVGDTDARLMEEIKKQRSEMAEMATMWQECLQRYRDMSNDFNSLKQQLAAPPESPTRMPAAPPPMMSPDVEPNLGPKPYHLPPAYPPMAQVSYGRVSSPSRTRGPPAWWCPEPPRRRSSPESRGSRDRNERSIDKDRRHRHKDRDDTRYKEKSSKTNNNTRSEHRHRKR